MTTSEYARMNETADELGRLRAALAAIMKACEEGRVCDDVAWFDQIETLWDFCDRMLNGERAAQNQPQEASR